MEIVETVLDIFRIKLVNTIPGNSCFMLIRSINVRNILEEIEMNEPNPPEIKPTIINQRRSGYIIKYFMRCCINAN